MMPEFKIGDKVETLDDDIKGQVILVKIDEIAILTQEGFEMYFKPNELIKIPDTDLKIKSDDLKQALAQKQQNHQKKPKVKTYKVPKKIEIDLHIHELIDDARGLSNFEILNIQLNKAKQQLEWAMEKRIKYVVFIHGVGEGVLKAELQTLFRRYDNLEFYDADYQTYGIGATEVCIY